MQVEQCVIHADSERVSSSISTSLALQRIASELSARAQVRTDPQESAPPNVAALDVHHGAVPRERESSPRSTSLDMPLPPDSDDLLMEALNSTTADSKYVQSIALVSVAVLVAAFYATVLTALQGNSESLDARRTFAVLVSSFAAGAGALGVGVHFLSSTYVAYLWCALLTASWGSVDS